ncbi:MAG: ScyD/ScyE family protein [Saprospiraceae bacterium]|nr:ScyD/ScyE family protein [Saprospiraceae bacterium]
MCIQVHGYAQLKSIAQELNSPIGVTADEWGNKWVAESGTGATDGASVVVTKSNKKHVVIMDLPSMFNPVAGDIVGPWKAIPMKFGKMAVIIVGCAPILGGIFGNMVIFDLAGFVPGTSAPLTLADAVQLIDVGTFSFNASDNQDSDPFSAVQDEDGVWFVADAGSNSIIRVSRNGKNMSVFAKFSPFANPIPVGPPMVDPVPTGIVAIPKYGGFLVTTLTGFPFLGGKAGIYHVDRSGNVSPYLLGLTLLTDIAMDKFKNIYVAQFGTFSLAGGFAFGSGQVIKIRNGKIIDTVATGYGPGSGITLNASGDKFYVTSLFTGELFESGIPAEEPANSLVSLETRGIENKLLWSLTAYPNPATDFVQINWTAPDKDIRFDIEMVDMAGRTWYQQNNVNSSNPDHRIQLEHMVSGNYLVKLKSNQGTEIQKISIRK